jgi:hypothetical protein
MSGGMSRLRIVVGDRELEVEGEGSFIESYRETIDQLLGALLTGSPERREDKKRPRAPMNDEDSADPEFGEQLGVLPKSATATDQVLLAGRFAQLASEDNTFVTKDANSLLLEQSIKVGNPSQCMTNNLNAKRVFKVGGKYRVSKAGEEYLDSLLGS